jgi:hypothetical protein
LIPAPGIPRRPRPAGIPAINTVYAGTEDIGLRIVLQKNRYRKVMTGHVIMRATFRKSMVLNIYFTNKKINRFWYPVSGGTTEREPGTGV